jgi:hypothetical protein
MRFFNYSEIVCMDDFTTGSHFDIPPGGFLTEERSGIPTRS